MILQDHRWVAICASFFSYLVVHSGRKAFTNTKTIAVELMGLNPEFAGVLDAQFMLAYALGLLVLGSLGDRCDPAKLLAASLVGMAFMQVLFSELCVAGIGSDIPGQVLLSVVWVCNGLVQSLSWPCCVKIVQASLNGRRHSSIIFSFWACNGILGNITCSIISSILMNEEPGITGFRLIFFITSICNVIMTFFVARLSRAGATPQEGSSLVEQAQPQALSVGDCVKLRGVLDYSVCHACIKAVAYAMFFWLPFYLVNEYGVSPSEAAGLSILYDMATLIGGPFCGFSVEKTRKPSSVIAVFVLLAAWPQMLINGANSDFSHILYINSIPASVTVNIVLTGFLVGGVLNVISAAVCAKLGGTTSTSTVTGVIDGAGSLGASLMQIFVPLLRVSNGWDWVFGSLSCLLLLSAFTLTRIVKDEWTSV